MYKPCINQLNYGAPLCAPQTAQIDVTATSRAVWAPRTTAPSDGPGRPLATKRGGCGEWIGGLAWNPVLRGSSNFRDDFSRSPEDFFLKGDFYHNLWGILAGTSQRSFFFLFTDWILRMIPTSEKYQIHCCISGPKSREAQEVPVALFPGLHGAFWPGLLWRPAVYGGTAEV